MEMPISTFIAIFLLITTIFGLFKTLKQPGSLTSKYIWAIGMTIKKMYSKAILLFRSGSVAFLITLIFSIALLFGAGGENGKQILMVIVLIGNVIGWTLILIASATVSKAEKMEAEQK